MNTLLEQYLTSPAAIWTVFFLTAATTGVVFDGLFRLIWKLYDMGRSNVIVVPEVAGGKYLWKRVRLKAGQEWETKLGDEKEIKICSSDASFVGTRGPLHLLTPYGANLVAPSKDEAIDASTGQPVKNQPGTFMRFRIHDPLTYWRAKRENAMEDLYSAQREKDHWAVKLAPVAIILFIGMLAFLGFMLWKILPLLHQAGAS